MRSGSGLYCGSVGECRDDAGILASDLGVDFDLSLDCSLVAIDLYRRLPRNVFGLAAGFGPSTLSSPQAG